MNTTEKIQEQLNEAGYDNAIAIATQAEIEAQAACGQLAMVVECDEEE
jgi:adenine C2-methylase RlmN of 23S rRNA A2503 and tRNA A37